MKRKLIASFMFDCGTAINSTYVPVITIYWDVENIKKPFQLSVKYAWEDFTVSYSYKNVMEFLEKHSFVELAKVEINKRIFDYDGGFKIDMENEFHFTEKGKCILASQSQDQVSQWIEKGQL